MKNTQDQLKKLEEEVIFLKAQVEQHTLFEVEKDRLENEFRRSQLRYRIIFEESAVGKKIIDDQLHIIKVNKALLRILGYTESEMLGRLITDFSHPDFVAHWKQLQEQLWTTNIPSFNFETCLLKKNNDIIWVHVTTILIHDNESTLGYTIMEDISERKEVEQLNNLIREQEQRQQIAETILNTQEEERRRIAESLHNGLGQLLYGVKLSLNDVRVKSSESQPGNERALQYTQQLLTDCIYECRRISHDLTPAMLQEHGLKEAVEDICQQLTNGVSFVGNIQGLEKRIDSYLEIAIYRMIQELSMNIVKHAEASRAAVHIVADETAIHIRVEDNGKGFNEEQQEKGIGLQTVRYKVNLLSGTLNVSSVEGKGTTINITIPKRIE